MVEIEKNEAQMIEVMARAILGQDLVSGELLMNAAVPEAYAISLAHAALDAIRGHVRIEKESQG